jgi:hypothetical protein
MSTEDVFGENKICISTLQAEPPLYSSEQEKKRGGG